jgi:hypothetical protein
MYGLEISSVTLSEERRLTVFEYRVLRKIFGLERDKTTGEWGRKHNEVLCGLHSLPNFIWMFKSRRMLRIWHVVCVEQRRGGCGVFGGETSGKETTWMN